MTLSEASFFLVFFFFLPPNIPSVSVLRNVGGKCHLAKSRTVGRVGPAGQCPPSTLLKNPFPGPPTGRPQKHTCVCDPEVDASKTLIG